MTSYVVPKPWGSIPKPYSPIYDPYIPQVKSEELDQFIINFDAVTSVEPDTFSIPDGKRMWITGIYVSFYCSNIAAVKGAYDLKLRQTGSWGSTGFTNKTLFHIPVCITDVDKGYRDQFFIPLEPAVPVYLGTRSLNFYSGFATAANIFFSGFITGYYLKE
jgi:hypothetical protein